jgi:hypothetical protein
LELAWEELAVGPIEDGTSPPFGTETALLAKAFLGSVSTALRGGGFANALDRLAVLRSETGGCSWGRLVVGLLLLAIYGKMFELIFFCSFFF